MALTPQQLQLLKGVSQRFNLNEEYNPLPLICYALDSVNYLKDDEYEVLKYANYSEESIDSSGVTLLPNWFSAVVLVFVRNFFERSNGRNTWFGNDSPNFTKNFRRGIQNDRPNYLLVEKERDEIRPWLLSQCWIIRQDNTSSIIANNRAMFEALIHYDFLRSDYSWQDVENMDISSIVVDYDVEDELITENEYLNYIWKNYKREYLLSLKALVTPRDNCQEAPAWLRAISSISDTIHGAVSWELRKTSDGSFSPALILDSSMKDCKICQGDLELPASVGVYHLWYLEEYGFDLSSTKDNPIVITKNEQLIAEVDSPFVLGKFILFKHRASKKCITRKSTLYGGYFYLFHRQETCAPSVELGNYRLLGENETNISRHLRYECKKYRIPYLPQDQPKSLCIGGEDTQIQVKTTPRIVPCNSSDIKIVGEERTIVVEDDVLRLYAYGLSNVKVNGECCFESEPQTCYYEIKPQLKIANQAGVLENLEAITYGTYLVEAQEHNGTSHSLKVVFLPKNWRRFCRKDDLYKSYKAAETKKEYLLYADPDGENHYLSCPMQGAVCFWVGNNNYLDVINEEQYESCQYCSHLFFGSSKIVDVKLRDVETGTVVVTQRLEDCDNFMDNIFRANHEKLRENRLIEASIGEKIIYRGLFRPRFCYMKKKQGNWLLYCPEYLRDKGFLRTCSVKFYFAHPLRRRDYFTSVSLSELKWRNDGFADISSIVESVDNTPVHFLYYHCESSEYALIAEKNVANNFNYCDIEKNDKAIQFLDRVLYSQYSSLRIYFCAVKYSVQVVSYDDIFEIDADINRNTGMVYCQRLLNKYVYLCTGVNDVNLYECRDALNCDWWPEQGSKGVYHLIACMIKWIPEKVHGNNVNTVLSCALAEDSLFSVWNKVLHELMVDCKEKVEAIWDELRLLGATSIRKLFLIAAILSVGKDAVKLSKKEKTAVSYIFSFFYANCRRSLYRMCVFVELLKPSPFKSLVASIIEDFGVCRMYNMPSPPGTDNVHCTRSWLDLVDTFVAHMRKSKSIDCSLADFYCRLATVLAHRANPNSISKMRKNALMVAALFRFIIKKHKLSRIVAPKVLNQCNLEFGKDQRNYERYRAMSTSIKYFLPSSF